MESGEEIMLVTAYQGNGKEKKILVFRVDLSKMAWVRVFYLVDVQRETACARAAGWLSLFYCS